MCGVDLDLWPGRTLALVGETGCGKSTLGRRLLGLGPATAGTVSLDGQDPARLERRERARRIQLIAQDARASIDPRMTVGAALAEPLRIHGWFGPGGRQQVARLLDTVGLAPELAGRRAHKLSGGQSQRVAVARALAVGPAIVVLDEAVSALDPTARAGVLALLAGLQQAQGLAYLFIAHDLAMVRQLAHDVAVMYSGRIVETGPAGDVYQRPAHPYTQALLSATPDPDPRVERSRSRPAGAGEVADPAAPPSGCRFRTRCHKAEPRCAGEKPALVERGQGHPVACHFAEVAVSPRSGGHEEP